MEQPLSRQLAAILEHNDRTDGMTLNQVLEKTGGRGIYAMMILLALPFAAPFSIAGTSIPFGLAIGVLAYRVARGLRARLPKRFGDRPISRRLKKFLRGGGMKGLRAIEKLVRPRRSRWLNWPAVRAFNALLLMLMALLLAAPLPPVPPFTNALPCYAIILLAASLMEEDGLIIWLGYAVAIGSVGYLAFWAGLIAKHLSQHWQAILRLLGIGV